MSFLVNPFVFASSGGVIPVNPTTFFDANEETTGVYASETVFTDQSGNGNDFVILGISVEIKDAQVDGQKAAEFLTANATFATSGLTTTLTDFSVFIVYRQLTHLSNNLGILQFQPASGSGYNEDDGLVFETGGSANRVSVLGGVGSAFSLESGLNAGWNLIALRMVGGSGDLYINGTLISNTSYGGFLTDVALTMGAYFLSGSYSNFVDAQIAAMACYNGVLSLGDFESVSDYFLTRFPSIP